MTKKDAEMAELGDAADSWRLCLVEPEIPRSVCGENLDFAVRLDKMYIK